jgi:hypothetical protein
MSLFDAPAFVSRPASEARARREAFTGKWTERRNLCMTFLLGSGQFGSTWKEVADGIGGHHGQVSSVLSSLHGGGFVFALREMRDGCHPYLHFSQRINFTDEQVFDSPTSTKAGRVKQINELFQQQIRTALAIALEDEQEPEAMRGLIDSIVLSVEWLDHALGDEDGE